MNLVEALKTDRPIRRKSWNKQMGWWDPKHLLDVWGRGDLRPWSRQDILADDWEVQDIPVSITREKFWDACSAALTEARSDRQVGTMYTIGAVIVLLAKKLGLE